LLVFGVLDILVFHILLEPCHLLFDIMFGVLDLILDKLLLINIDLVGLLEFLEFPLFVADEFLLLDDELFRLVELQIDGGHIGDLVLLRRILLHSLPVRRELDLLVVIPFAPRLLLIHVQLMKYINTLVHAAISHSATENDDFAIELARVAAECESYPR
jgi:hypothetical protein